MKRLLALFQKYREIILYLVFGVLTTLVDILVFSLLAHTCLTGDGFQMQLANLFAWIAAVVFAYVTNRTLVFESRDGRMLAEALRFLASRLLTLLADALLLFLLASLLGMQKDIANLLCAFAVILLNYVFSKLWVFRTKGLSSFGKTENGRDRG